MSNISKEDLTKIAKENLLPTGSRVMEDTGKGARQVYPTSPKIIKGNIAAELGWEEELPESFEDE